MHWSPARLRGLLAALLLVPTIAVLGGAQPAAAVAQLPFTVTNDSGRADATHIYVIARNGLTGKPGYVDANGAWRAYTFPGSIPAGQPNPAAPDVSIPGPANGASKQITLPPDLSGGRIYVSFGAPLKFFLTANGLVEPAPWVASDPNHDVLYDWAEFARVGGRIFINTTTVDMFSVPMAVTVKSAAGVSHTEGALNAAGRTGVLSSIAGLGGDWAKLTYTRASDGLPLRVLAPVHGIANGAFGSTFLDSYISGVWSYHQSHPLTVQTSLGTFTGTVSGSAMTFRSASGSVIGALTKPTTSDVFGCSGGTQPQGQPDETAILAVGARVCAGLHRATLSTAGRVMDDTQPSTAAAKFYQQPSSDLYSKVMHDHAVSGHAYGFAYDDVAGFAPVIDEPDPASATLTLGTFGGTSGGGTGNTATGTAYVGPGGKCLDVAGDDNGGNGTAVQLWDCQGYAVDQHWTLSGGLLKTLGKCLDVKDAGTANRSQLQLWDCSGGGNQQWVAQGDGSIKNVGSGRCLDSPAGAIANGTRLQIYDCNGTPAQIFTKA